MLRGWHASLGALAIAVVTVAVAACGTDPVGVESCRRIESVRCESAQACDIDLGQPVHRGDSPERAVASCIRFYDDACLHGFVASNDPGGDAVQACVDAIITGDCNVVRTPEIHPACAFLVPPAEPPPPPPPPPDAGDQG